MQLYAADTTAAVATVIKINQWAYDPPFVSSDQFWASTPFGKKNHARVTRSITVLRTPLSENRIATMNVATGET